MINPVHLREIGDDDDRVIAKLLDAMDPEDAELAQEALADGQTIFSLAEVGDRPVAIVAVKPIETAESSAWLSATAFLPECDRQVMVGTLKAMVDECREAGLTRIVAMEADSVEGAGAIRHEDYLRSLKEAGFETASRLEDFYDRRESAVYLVCRVSEVSPRRIEQDTRSVVFNDLYEHEESDGGYVADWSYHDDVPDDNGLADIIEDARHEGARLLVCSSPSNLSSFAPTVSRFGFTQAGVINGFHAPGIHEVQFLLRL